jgi:D-alanyl-D-alanine carboxypeptidase
MLVTFSCPAYADITMFGDVAIHLLKLMGHSGVVPSALLADDIRPALDRLQAAVAAHQEPPQAAGAAGDRDDEPAVSLRHRALPLIELLKAADKAECNVMWDSNL